VPARCFSRSIPGIMYSIPPPGAPSADASSVPLPLPMVEGHLHAGFPSPADDFSVKRQDLNDLLITHPLATFYWQVSGRSMEEAGIGDGDILVVNRALTPQHRQIVVAQVDGNFTVKYLHKRAGSVKLVAANPTFPEIVFKEGQELIICGVVTAAIKRFVS
jgi:DNA polymerase V